MKLLELHLAGFGRLVDRTFTFAPGLNLVYGPNEAGKSTLQRAIMALLFGFFDEGRISQEHRAVLAANKPWDPKASFAGRLIYALDDGHRFQVKRTFDPRLQTRLASLPDNTDVGGQFRNASDGRLLFAEMHLGMSRPVFDNVCSVRQAELAALESSAVDAINATIMRLSASGSSDTTTDDALAALEKALRDDIGSPRAWTKPLAQTTQRTADLEKQRSAAQRERDDLLTQIGALRQAEDESKRLNAGRQKLSYLQALAERDTLQQQKATVQEAAQAVDLRAAEVARWAQWAEFPVHLRDDVLLLDSQRKRLQDEYRRIERRAVEAEQALQPLRTEVAAVETHIAELADAKHIPDDQLPAVRELATQWQRAAESKTRARERFQNAETAFSEANSRRTQQQAEIQPIISLGRSGLAKLQQQLTNSRQRVAQAEVNLQKAQTRWGTTGMSEAQFLELEHKAHDIRSGARPAPPPHRGCNPFSSGEQLPVRAPTELVLYDQIKPIHDEVSLWQVKFADAKQELTKDEADGLRLLGPTLTTPLDEASFERLGARLDDQLQAQAVANQHKSTVDDALVQLKVTEQTCNAATDALRVRLAELGFAAPDLNQTLAAFVQQCERKQRLVQEEATLERLHLRAQSLQREEEERQRQANSLQETETQLQGLLLKAGIERSQSTLADGLSTFHERVEDHTRWVKAVATHGEATRHYRGLVEVQQRAGIDTRLAEIGVSIADLKSRYPEWVMLKPERSAQEYAALQTRAEQAHADAYDRHRRLKDANESASASLTHPAEIDEGIAALRAEIKHLEWYRDALKLAYDELAGAKQEYQQQFAPRLERLMSEGLTRISDSRYTEATVDPSTLAVSLKAPERQELVSVANLSTGTRDLVYLMLRVAVARLLSRSAETLPLMLDDPLVQFDRGRQERTLKFLSQLAADTQVFLFTKDEWTKEWFEQNLSQSAIHAVHQLR